MLRNGLYADRVVQQAVEMLKAGQVIVTPNEAKSALVTREDCAAVAAGALLNARFENTAFDITGPAVIGVRDIAQAASAITGKRIEVLEQPAGEATSGMAAGGIVTPPIVTNAVAELSGRTATGLRAFLEANKAQLMAAAN